MSSRVSLVSTGVAVCVMVVGLAPSVGARAFGGLPGSAPQLTAPAVATDLPPESPDWGISTYTAYNVPAFAFSDIANGEHGFVNGYLFRAASVSNYFTAPVYLPSGAVVSGVTVFYNDTDPTGYVQVYIDRYACLATEGPGSQELFSDTSSGTEGFHGGYRALPIPETVRNVDPATRRASMYAVHLGMLASGVGDLGFGGLTVWYRRQVSPAPASATFHDVPTNYWAFRHVEALAASGITTGCGSGNYCPESYVKRSEVAVYLAKALGLHWPDANTLP